MALDHEPQIQQMFESPPSKDVLPDITLRPDSAARPAARSASLTRSGSGTGATSSSSSGINSKTPMAAQAAATARASAPAVFPMGPAQALEKYRRVLTTYEQEEILQYPQVYFLAPMAKKIQASEDKGMNCGFDDDKGRYKCVKNDHIAYRYEIVKGLGKGSFGDVVKTYDHKIKAHVAVKIIRNEKRFHKQGQIEVKILELLKRQDRTGTHNVIHIADWFLFRNHLCITFELLHSDLYSALKLDGFKGYPLDRVRHFATSILASLRMLRRNRIIHCDLKPENILLCQKGSDEIKVIDFGSACFDTQRIHSYIQSRFYRSPEVILGTGYGLPIDMWSLGCILTELLTGHPLFPGHDEKEQLLFQMEVLGLPPADLLTRSKRASMFFDATNKPRYLTDKKERVRTPGTRTLAKAVGCDDALFLDFVAGCLRWDPEERMTPREASRHPFIIGTVAAAAAAAAEAAEMAAAQAAAAHAHAQAQAGPVRSLHRSLSEGASASAAMASPSSAGTAMPPPGSRAAAVAAKPRISSLASTSRGTSAASSDDEGGSAMGSNPSLAATAGAGAGSATSSSLPKIAESPPKALVRRSSSGSLLAASASSAMMMSAAAATAAAVQESFARLNTADAANPSRLPRPASVRNSQI